MPIGHPASTLSPPTPTDEALRVAMDVSFAVQWFWLDLPTNGICRVTTEWLRHLPAALGAPATATVSLSYDPLTWERRMHTMPQQFPGAALERSFTSRSGQDRLYLPLRRPGDLRWRERALKQVLLALDARRLKPQYDVLHSITEALPPRMPGRVQLLSVFDLIPIRYPELTPVEVSERAGAVIASAANADVIVVNTEWVKGDVVEHCRVDPDHVAVVPLAAARVFAEQHEPDRREALRQALGVRRPYFLAVEGHARKDTAGAIAAYVRATDGLSGAPDLVIVGGTALRIRHPRIRLVDAVPDETLAALMADTHGFIFLSRAEGFGLQVVEAMAAGAPVVAAANTCIPEVVGSGGICVPGGDTDGVASVIRSFATEDSVRERLSNAGRARARAFTWERSARSLAEAYRAALRYGQA